MLFVFLALGISFRPRRPSISTRFTDKTPIKESKGETLCDVCNQLVAYAKELIGSATLEEEIKEFLIGYCDTLGWPTKDICKTAINQYLPSIIQMIEDQIDSYQICQKIGFCNATTKFVRKIKTIKQLRDETPQCDLCQKLVQVIDVLLDSSVVEEEIQELALSYCDSYGWPTKDICKSAVKTYLPSFIKYLEDNVTPIKICQNVGFCTAEEARKVKVVPRKYSKGETLCDVCNQLVAYAKELIGSATLEEEIKEFLIGYCDTLGWPTKDICKTAINQYLPSIIQMIEDQIDSYQICQKIGFCNATSIKYARKPKTIRQSIRMPNDDISCETCKEMVNYIAILLDNQETLDEITTIIDQLCSTYPSPYDSLCKNVVDNYLPQVVEFIRQGLDPTTVCQKISMCNNVARSHKKRKVNDDSPVCDICQKLVQVIDVLLDNATVEEEIEELALSYCDNYGWPVKDICRSAIKTYLPSFIKYLEDDITSIKVCQNVGLCNATSRVKSANLASFRSEEGCQTCQKWFTWAEDKLDEVTVEGLWKLISEECPKVPYLSYFCQAINEQNIQTFVSIILSALPPQQCCEWIKVC